jgi:cell division protein FtsL
MEEQKDRDSAESKPDQNIPPISSANQPDDSSIHREKREDNTNTGVNRFSSWTKAEKMMAFLTAVIAIATIINIVVFWLESESASKQTTRLIEEAGKIADSMKETVGQAKKALDVTKNAIDTNSVQSKKALESSAKQAQDALTASQVSANLDQRAWVGLVGVDTQGGERTPDAFKFQSIIVTVRNSGKTPAIKLSGECCMYVNRLWTDPIPDYDTETKREEDERKKYDEERQKRNADTIARHPEMADDIKEFEQRFASSSTTKLHTGGVLAPGIINSIGVAPSMSWGLSRKPGEPPRILYVLGRFTYNDIFNGTPRHSTKFCLMYDRGNSFSICPESNWMD